MKEGSLKQKTIKGVGWSAIDNVSSFAVSFVVGVILARMLSPEDYGLLGMTAIFTSVSWCFINSGLGLALIRKKDATEEDYNTVFIFNLGMSLFLYIVFFIAAPYIADFFGRSELIILTRVTTISMIISSFSAIQRVRLTKQINFKEQTKITIIVAVVRGIVGVFTAYIGWGVWALVFQELVGSLLSTVLLCYYNHWMPSPTFSMKSFKELFGFGSKFLIIGIIDTAWKELNKLVIGKFYTPDSLGQYTRSTMFSGLLSSNITNVIQRVSYPVLSTIQDDLPRLKNGYRRIIKITMLLTFEGMLMLAVVSKSMILVLIGSKWLQAALFLQILCISQMLYPLHALNINMLQVQGRSDLILRLEIMKKTIAIGPLLLGVFISIYWMLIGGIISGVIAYFLNSFYSGSLIGYSTKEQLIDILPHFLISSASALVAFLPSLAYDIIWSGSDWNTMAFVIFPLQLFLGIMTFVIINERYSTNEYLELKDIFVSSIKKLVYK